MGFGLFGSLSYLDDDVDPLFLVPLIQLQLSGGHIGGGSELQNDPTVQNLFRISRSCK